MIVKINERSPANIHLSALEKREWKYRSEDFLGGQRIASREPTKVEFRKMLYAMPLLFASGIFTGIAIMLALSNQ